jgi:hypothetical protein
MCQAGYRTGSAATATVDTFGLSWCGLLGYDIVSAAGDADISEGKQVETLRKKGEISVKLLTAYECQCNIKLVLH